MKRAPRSLLIAAACSAISLPSQAIAAPTAPTLSVGAPVASPIAPLAPVAPPVLALNLAPTEAQRVFTATVDNSSATPMTVLGAQTTSGLFVSQMPAVIPAKGSAAFSLVYFSQAGTASTSDLLRVLTDQGIQTIQIDHDRAPTVQFDSVGLQWQVGEAAAGKSVNMTVAAGAGTPSGVVALGAGNQAKLTSTGTGTYRITVTPASTVQAESFPVIIQFPNAPPDAQLTITCTVGGA